MSARAASRPCGGTALAAWLGTTLVVAALPAGAAARQEPLRLGDLLRLRVEGAASPAIGRLRSLGPERLRVALDPEDSVATYPLVGLTSLEVHRGGGARGVLEAAGIGWLAGLAASELYLLVTEGAPWADDSGATFATGAIGGLAIGMTVGAVRRNRWEPVSLVGLSPMGAARGRIEPDFSAVRSWVRLRTLAGEEHEGAVRRAGPRTLDLELPDGERVAIPFDSLSELEIHRGRARRPLRWAVEGFLGGALLGAVVGLGVDRFSAFGCVVGDCPESRSWRYARRGAVEGLVAGLILGLVREVERWEDVPPAEVPSVVVAARPDRGIELGVSVRTGGAPR